MLWCRAQLWFPHWHIPCKVWITFSGFSFDGQEKMWTCSDDFVWWIQYIQEIWSLQAEKLFLEIALLIVKIVYVPGIRHTVDELWSWRMVCIGTGSGHHLLTLLRMICTPLTAYMNSGLVIILRFSGEGTKNSHMVCSRAPNNACFRLCQWNH